MIERALAVPLPLQCAACGESGVWLTLGLPAEVPEAGPVPTHAVIECHACHTDVNYGVVTSEGGLP